MFLFEPTQCYSISDNSFKLSKQGLVIIQYDDTIIELLNEFPLHLSLVAGKLCLGTLKYDFIAHKYSLDLVDLVFLFDMNFDKQILNIKTQSNNKNLLKIELEGNPFSISISEKHIQIIIPG
ncbi:MAG: hypothetical protein AB7G44_15655 [Bacteroidia bacterium]